MSRAGAPVTRSAASALSPRSSSASGTPRVKSSETLTDCPNVRFPMLRLLRTNPWFFAVLALATENVSGWILSTVLRRKLLEPDQVMLFQKRASVEGAPNRVIGERDRFTVGRVHSVRSSERYCFRFADIESAPQLKRRLIPPSESIDWVTSRGLNEFSRTKSLLEA